MGAGLDTQQPPLPPGRRPVAPPLDKKTGRPVQTPKPLPKPLPISKGGKPILAPLPDKKVRGPVQPPPQEQPRYKSQPDFNEADFVDRGPYRPSPTQPRSPIDMVRDPGFGSAMDERNYGNLLRDIIGSISAARGEPPVGYRAPQTPQYSQPEIDARLRAALKAGVGMGGQQGNPGSDRFDDFRGQPQPSQPRPSGPDFVDNRDPNMNYSMNMINYYDPATGEVTSRTNGIAPGPGSRFTKYSGQLPQGPNGEQLGYIPGYVPQRPQQGPPGGGMGGTIGGNYNRPPQGPQFTQDRLMGAPVEQQPGYGIPQGPQTPQAAMAAYNNLLQQGMQRSNAMNQDAATNFANLQAGAPKVPTTPTANIPAAGFGAQKPKAPTFKPTQGFANIKAF